MQTPKHILPIIVLAQFCCTSLWFAGNGVLTDLVSSFGLGPNTLGSLTAAVQLGFISGTLVFAILSFADRFSPTKLFLASAILGAFFNGAVVWEGNTLYSILSLRFLTGFFLAGIYPVGMKIAADYFNTGLGKSLGYLVGALVLGTALPHGLKALSVGYSYELVLGSISALAVLGGLLIFLFVPDGPYRKPSIKLDFSAFFGVFKQADFRAAAFGYFGHMWELYAFWAFVPVMIMTYNDLHPSADLNVSLISFIVIGIGSLACVAAGYISQGFGLKKTAFFALLGSGICCVLSPVFFNVGPVFFVMFLLIWGVLVIADSPLFSTLVAQNANGEHKGTALTIVNCVGFAITIGSIQLLSTLLLSFSPTNLYQFLALGPALGLLALKFSHAKS